MSIILKGIDMSKDIDELRLIINGMSIAIEPTEAIQIDRPHGRLIDASELIKSYMKGTKTDIDDFYDTIDIIDNAPTILEEEE